MTTTMTRRDERKQKQGRGQGKGDEYTPYIYTQEFRTRARSCRHRRKGMTTGRTHHLLSTLELGVFYVYDFSPFITDIQEQYPLDQFTTLRIAERLGIRHPSRRTRQRVYEPIIMTSDFLLTVQKQEGTQPYQCVRSVKSAHELYNRRTVAKLEIERVYWEIRGIDWKIITDREIPDNLVWNLEELYSFRTLDDTNVSNEQFKAIRTRLNAALCPKGIVLNRVARRVDNALGLKHGTSINVAKHLIATRQWKADLSERIKPGAVTQIVNIGG